MNIERKKLVLMMDKDLKTMTQAELANNIGLSVMTLNRIIHGADGKLSTWERIATYYSKWK